MGDAGAKKRTGLIPYNQGVADFAADVYSLILMHADPAFTLGKVRNPMQDDLDQRQPQAVGDEEDDTTVHHGVCAEPVIPNWKQARLIIMNLVIAILAVTHSIGLQHKVSQSMAKDQHEKGFNKWHVRIPS